MAMAAMAAVSARRMRGPRVTDCHWCWVKREISSGVQPPSGPMAKAWVILDVVWLSAGWLMEVSSAADSGVDCSVSLRRMR